MLEEVVSNLDPEDYWVVTMAGPIPNEWIRLRDDYRNQLEAMLQSLIRNGIAERHIAIEEAKAVLLVSQIREAARDAGLSPTQVKALGASLRARLESA